MPRESKANRVTAETRVNKVYELLVNGLTRHQIWLYVTTNESGKALFAGVSIRQLDRYIAEANGLLGAEAEFHRARELGKAIARLNELFQRCMKVQDYQRALAVQREINTLLGLYAPPPPQTLKLLGIDPAELTTVSKALQQHGLKASDVFNAMLAELIQEQKRNGR